MSLATPRIDALLSSLRRALRRQVWLHGLGTVAAAGAGWLLFAYLADRFLHVPGPVRIVHTAVAVALPIYFLWKRFIGPMAMVPGRSGLAVLAGRAAPETEDLIVSAVQLAAPDRPESDKSSESPELVARVVSDAEAAAPSVNIRAVLDPSGPRKRAWMGAGAVAACSVALLAQPAMTKIFFARAFGAAVPWPRRTTLVVEIPMAGERDQVEMRGDEIFVRAARGSDVPVLVRAEGVVPSEVILRFKGGYESVLASGGTALFRTSLRAVQEDLSFWVTGGDDDDSLPMVHLEVLQPPDVAGLAFDVSPPAYTGLPNQLVFGTSVDVLEGSKIRVHVQPDPVDATGEAHLFPSDESLALNPSPFPLDPKTLSEAPPSDALEVPGLAFELTAMSSLRFSVDLVDTGGLPNPDPGLFAIQVTPDRKPELTLLSPSRTELDVVAGGAIPLRVRVGDDFGLVGMAWDVRPTDDPEASLSSGSLELLPFAPSAPGQERQHLRDERLAHALLEVQDLDPSQPASDGQVMVLQLVATDKREPVPGEAQSPPVRIRVVTGEEYERRLKENLARAGERAGSLSQLGLTLASELSALADTYASGSDPDGEGDFGDPEQMAYGARRLAGDTRVLGRDLAGLAEGLIYSRLDPRSGSLLAAVDSALAKDAERTFRPEPWIQVAQDYREGRLGQADLAGDLVGMVGLALAVSETHVPAVAEALNQAGSADNMAAERAAVERALDAARLAQADLETLLTRLGEWDNMQSVLNLARDIADRMKNLNQRTKSFAEDH